jgi:hypothetical protein
MPAAVRRLSSGETSTRGAAVTPNAHVVVHVIEPVTASMLLRTRRTVTAGSARAAVSNSAPAMIDRHGHRRRRRGAEEL